MTTSPADSPTDEELAELQETVERLSQSIDVLTSAVDELTDLLNWHNNNSGRDEQPEPIVLKSLPLDPTTDEWQINRAVADGNAGDAIPVTRPADRRLFD